MEVRPSLEVFSAQRRRQVAGEMRRDQTRRFEQSQVMPDKTLNPHYDHAGRRPVQFVGALLAVAIAGCGNGISSVSGTLSLDGQPLASAEDTGITIMFYPASGTGAPAAARVDTSGRYVLSTGSRKGIQPGEYVVTVSGAQMIQAASGVDAPQKRQLTPLKYANPKLSGLRAEVQPGSNTFDFELKSSQSG